MIYLNSNVKAALVIATITVALDWTFHWTLTSPMETFDYFTVKWLLAFFMATIFLNWPPKEARSLGNAPQAVVFAGVFSFLMSLYYRWWEYFSRVPFSVRAPDIVFVNRESVVLFAGTWFVAHSLFFLIGIFVARKFVNDTRQIPA